METDETSLEDFLEGVETDANEDEDDRIREKTPREGDDSTSATTYAWAEGGECAVCEKAAEGRWREGDRFVCADCKSW